MSYDEYANYICQKYRLSTAIAIIKTKPETMSTEQYIDVLRSKVNDGSDLDVTMLSDDFLIDDSTEISETILKDFDELLADDDRDEHLQNRSEPQNPIQDPTQNQIFTAKTNDRDNDVTFCDVQNDASGVNNGMNELANNNTNLNQNLTDTQNTIIYSVHGFTQNCSHYSPSQNNLTIPEKYIKRISKTIDKPIFTNDVVENKLNSEDNLKTLSANNHLKQTAKVDDRDINNIYSQNVSQIFTELQDIPPNDVTTNILNDNDFEKILIDTENNSFIKYTQSLEQYFKPTKSVYVNDVQQEINMDGLEHDRTELDRNMENNSAGIIKNKLLPIKSLSWNNVTDVTITPEKLKSLDHSPIESSNDINNIDSNANNLEINDKLTRNHSNIHNSTEIIEIDRFNSTNEELIPFKVLTEYNQVKHFLSKRERTMSVDGYSTDSGYRSDSQSKYSNRNAFPASQVRLNQASHCLFDHITNCPLVVNTRDITTEIAEVLGQMINRLHEEESYPQFLEELLESVGALLTRLSEENCNDQLLKKDEILQRLILLNRSVHIQRYSIDKINIILNQYHTKLTNTDNLFEITDTIVTENSYYIFHLLELLLKKYVKKKDSLTQNSDVSQEEISIFKKSDLSVIWKRKWDPKTDSATVEKKTCVLVELSEILNKIIVDCMNSYSLISYAALNCFNLLQS